jgi:hypothetical protein
LKLIAMSAEWFTAIGTIVLAGGTVILAFVAIFQDTVRGWIYRPKLEVSIQPQPPNCFAVPMTHANRHSRSTLTTMGSGTSRLLASDFGDPIVADGTPVPDSIYLRLWVKNTAKTAARNVEVYASELLRSRADNVTWDRVNEFTPMNLRWADLHLVYFSIIVRGMGKHCDLGHIVDPARRASPNLRNQEENPRLGLTDQQTSLTFDLITAPNHKGHIVGPGHYRLKILVAAENSRRPLEKTISIVLTGNWYQDEARMLRDGVNVSIM